MCLECRLKSGTVSVTVPALADLNSIHHFRPTHVHMHIYWHGTWYMNRVSGVTAADTTICKSVHAGRAVFGHAELVHWRLLRSVGVVRCHSQYDCLQSHRLDLSLLMLLCKSLHLWARDVGEPTYEEVVNALRACGAEHLLL